jgi:hypothetical protein
VILAGSRWLALIRWLCDDNWLVRWLAKSLAQSMIALRWLLGIYPVTAISRAMPSEDGWLAGYTIVRVKFNFSKTAV